jgi:hypothetical protein
MTSKLPATFFQPWLVTSQIEVEPSFSAKET